jgi:hypothetical protein
VQAKIIKLVELKNGGRLSPINLVIFAGTQNGEFSDWLNEIAILNSVSFFRIHCNFQKTLITVKDCDSRLSSQNFGLFNFRTRKLHKSANEGTDFYFIKN